MARRDRLRRGVSRGPCPQTKLQHPPNQPYSVDGLPCTHSGQGRDRGPPSPRSRHRRTARRTGRVVATASAARAASHLILSQLTAAFRVVFRSSGQRPLADSRTQKVAQEREFLNRRRSAKMTRVRAQRPRSRKQGSEIPANCGPFSKVSRKTGNRRLDGGGGSRAKPVSNAGTGNFLKNSGQNRLPTVSSRLASRISIAIPISYTSA